MKEWRRTFSIFTNISRLTYGKITDSNILAPHLISYMVFPCNNSCVQLQTQHGQQIVLELQKLTIYYAWELNVWPPIVQINSIQIIQQWSCWLLWAQEISTPSPVYCGVGFLPSLTQSVSHVITVRTKVKGATHVSPAEHPVGLIHKYGSATSINSDGNFL
jgi:hypothetical protein